ncbi:hypothetical protein H696_04034 [Fonticula alba]|uniref:Uncharacterized protein n=1 Tax=Fonticula alba TaxID=691883 RepID=A0A058Z5S9_FONAL|nr:hypothetical protein H696_04034 [Fonticula alba]KCV69615.1 hypothetical protein H696_04034 [Fonticula alba]|eukprot:XP_009496180.1 hypothetical protein H696_04034 [Fonticula alba]
MLPSLGSRPPREPDFSALPRHAHEMSPAQQAQLMHLSLHRAIMAPNVPGVSADRFAFAVDEELRALRAWYFQELHAWRPLVTVTRFAGHPHHFHGPAYGGHPAAGVWAGPFDLLRDGPRSMLDRILSQRQALEDLLLPGGLFGPGPGAPPPLLDGASDEAASEQGHRRPRGYDQLAADLLGQLQDTILGNLPFPSPWGPVVSPPPPVPAESSLYEFPYLGEEAEQQQQQQQAMAATTGSPWWMPPPPEHRPQSSGHTGAPVEPQVETVYEDVNGSRTKVTTTRYNDGRMSYQVVVRTKVDPNAPIEEASTPAVVSPEDTPAGRAK